jgi:hypothetical protein
MKTVDYMLWRMWPIERQIFYSTSVAIRMLLQMDILSIAHAAVTIAIWLVFNG